MGSVSTLPLASSIQTILTFLNLSTIHSFQQHNEAASTGSRKGQELSKADNLKRYLSADNDSPKSKRQKRSGTRFPRKGADVLPQIGLYGLAVKLVDASVVVQRCFYYFKMGMFVVWVIFVMSPDC